MVQLLSGYPNCFYQNDLKDNYMPILKNLKIYQTKNKYFPEC